MTTKNLIAAALGAAVLVPASPALAGDGRFAGTDELGVEAPTSVATGDFNGDGRTDVVVGAHEDQVARVYFRKPEGGLRLGVVRSARPIRRIAVADFNVDGRDDLAIAEGEASATTGAVFIWLGGTNNRFTFASATSTNGRVLSMVAGDFDGDRGADVAISANQAPTTVLQIRRGDRRGGLHAPFVMAAPIGALGVFDLTGDGRDDVVHAGPPTGPTTTSVSVGGGDMAAGREIALPGPVDSARPFSTGDFDEDGRLDLVAAVGRKHLVAVRLGNDTIVPEGGIDLPVGSATSTPAASAVGDVNADGHDDIVVSDTSAPLVHVLLGDGKVGFTPAPSVPVGFGPTAVALADLDGDGNDDLITADIQSNAVSIRHGLGAPALAGNLVVNGGFEGPAATGLIEEQPEIPGWERVGAATYARYGALSANAFPRITDAPRFSGGGRSFLWGGDSVVTNGVTEAWQRVDLGGAAAAIDEGRATARLSAWLGGALASADRIAVTAKFLDVRGEPLGTLELGPVGREDRTSRTTMVRRAGSLGVPAGTRFARVSVTSTVADKGSAATFADNVKLTLDEAPPAPVAGDAPQQGEQPRTGEQPSGGSTGTPRATFSARTGLTLKLLKRGRVRITNRNAFAVSGTLRVRAGAKRLKARRFGVAARKASVVRIALPRRARRVRLTAVVRDPAGVTRTVSKRVVLRAVNPRKA